MEYRIPDHLIHKFVNAEYVAAMLHRNVKTIRRWANEGLIPSIRLNSRVRLFHPESVLESLRRREYMSAIPRPKYDTQARPSVTLCQL
ncbi:MAG: helix-turn-helix domain-containing protein [Phycisphaerae bacterium]|nr:helix-turn-helix domain-containing protein [Phycisphaerae bacterium]